ncbi:hypothetical protein D3C87_1428370 [compost metagenome]
MEDHQVPVLRSSYVDLVAPQAPVIRLLKSLKGIFIVLHNTATMCKQFNFHLLGMRLGATTHKNKYGCQGIYKYPSSAGFTGLYHHISNLRQLILS